MSSSTRGRSELVNFIKEEDWIKKNVIENHSHNSTAEGNFDPNNLLKIVNTILIGTNGLIDKDGDSKQAPKDALGTFFPSNLSLTPKDVSGTIIPNNILLKINQICCQITCEAGRGNNQEQRLREFFRELSSYRWFTQVLVVLAAFAVHYGSFWYLSEAPCDGNGLLKGLSSLKRNLISDDHKKAIKKVVNDLLELTNALSLLVNAMNENRGKHIPELAEANPKIPLWSCQSIIAILAAGNYFELLIEADKFAESELGDLELIVSIKKNEVSKERKACEKALAWWENYWGFVRKLEAPVDIVDFLITLLAGEDAAQDPIRTGPNNTSVKLETFRKDRVLLILGLKLSQRDVAIFQRVHDDPALSAKIKLVWIPFVDGMPDNVGAQPKFELQMPWAFMVPRELNEYARKYIHDELHFQGGTMAVELDLQGLPKDKNHPDVMPMLRIMGPRALYPDRAMPTHLWVEDVIKPLVPGQKLDAIKTEYTLFYGGAAATKLESNVTHDSLSVVHIEDMEHFFERLRSCLIYRLIELKTEDNPLCDSIVWEMSEAYKARQIGGFKILTKGSALQIQHIGTYQAFSTLVSDLKWAMQEVTNKAVANIAEAFKKKEAGFQQLSGCKHFYVPFHPGLGLWRCPDPSQSVSYDLGITCCPTRPDDARAHHAGSLANATTK